MAYYFIKIRFFSGAQCKMPFLITLRFIVKIISHIVLASTSPYRNGLLAKLELPFQCANPDIDKTPRLQESAVAGMTVGGGSYCFS